MQFTSIPFFIFLCVTLVAYYLIPDRFRKYLLLLASYYFYLSAKPEYLIILLISTGVNFVAAIGIQKWSGHKKNILVATLIFDLGILFFFKYFNFIGAQINGILDYFTLNLTVPSHSLILPIGISFYTFMAIGYILDVYWGDIKYQKNYVVFSLYLGFFPYILSGPIGRAKDLFRQIGDSHPALYDNFSMGFRLIMWGLFKKMAVADNISIYVDAVFGNIPMHSTLTLIITAILYPIQLFADFSGYTDIARGVGRLFGFTLMENFRAPYTNSISITDYWKRNHISLTSWLRDYIFYPLMGSSSSKLRMYLGMFVMFLASGFWHGASWMFIIWGSLQATLLIFEDALKITKRKHHYALSRILSILSTYFIISISLLFFRLPDLISFGEFFSGMCSLKWHYYIGTTRLLPPLLVTLPIIIVMDKLMDNKQFDAFICSWKPIFRWSMYVSLIFIVLLFGNLNGSSFIYYEF